MLQHRVHKARLTVLAMRLRDELCSRPYAPSLSHSHRSLHPERRGHTHHQEQHHQRPQRQVLPRVKIQRQQPRVAQHPAHRRTPAESSTACTPRYRITPVVASTVQKTRCAKTDCIGPGENQKLTHKAVQHRQPHQRERRDHNIVTIHGSCAASPPKSRMSYVP